MTYEIYISTSGGLEGSYYKTNAIFKDVEISRKRHEDNPLLLYYEITGDILLYDIKAENDNTTDYDRFLPYLNEQKSGFLREIDENGNYAQYQILVSFDNEFNDETRFISAKIEANEIVNRILKGWDVPNIIWEWDTNNYKARILGGGAFGVVYKLSLIHI